LCAPEKVKAGVMDRAVRITTPQPLPSTRRKRIVTSAEESNQALLWATRVGEGKA
jgi:hypothetical protein